MEENFEFKFTGPKDENDLEKKKAKDGLARLRLKGLEKIGGEIEKTELQKEAIRTVNQIILLIFRYFGIEKYEQIDPEQVHFLHTDEFNKNTDHSNVGAYSPVDGGIIMNADKINDDKARLVATLLHEALHAVSEQYFYVKSSEDGKHFYDARVGLRTRSPWKDDESRMTGLNEFLVNSMVYYSLTKLTKMLNDRFGITVEDLQRPIYGSGTSYQDFFEELANKMAESKKVNINNFVGDLVRSHFSGSLLFLKDIDLIFGKGSIQVLSFLGSLKDKERVEKADALVEEYFLSAGEDRKKEIQDILSEV